MFYISTITYHKYKLRSKVAKQLNISKKPYNIHVPTYKKGIRKRQRMRRILLSRQAENRQMVKLIYSEYKPQYINNTRL